MIWKFQNFKFKFADKDPVPLIMGILNFTPDSFSGDGLSKQPQKVLEVIRRMECEGADLLDLGAISTRPGASMISEREELKRLIPFLKKIRKKTKLPISIDTQRSEVARQCLEVGANIINDVSCLRHDSAMIQVVHQFKAGLIVMHSRGNSKTMGTLNTYRNLTRDVAQELKVSLLKAKKAGIPRSSIAIDPGIGFAKKGKQNIKLLQSLESFKKLGYPIALGISRKSFIGEIVNLPPGDRDFASTALHSLLTQRGVHVLRVHSVGAAKQAILVTQAFMK